MSRPPLAVLAVWIVVATTTSLGACTRRAPAARDTASAGAPFRARGNEPGWSLEIGDRQLTLTADYGDTRVAAPTPSAVTSPGSRRYATRAQGHAIEVTVLDRPCADGMSGFPFPSTVAVRLDGRELRGCGGETIEVLQGAEWLVREIDRAAVLESSRVTLSFGPDGRVSGGASCNSYSGSYALRGDELTLSNLAATRRACAPPLMQQENQFLERLRGVRRFELRPDGTLVLQGDGGRAITARR